MTASRNAFRLDPEAVLAQALQPGTRASLHTVDDAQGHLGRAIHRWPESPAPTEILSMAASHSELTVLRVYPAPPLGDLSDPHVLLGTMSAMIMEGFRAQMLGLQSVTKESIALLRESRESQTALRDTLIRLVDREEARADRAREEARSDAQTDAEHKVEMIEAAATIRALQEASENDEKLGPTLIKAIASQPEVKAWVAARLTNGA